jgi:hypothetical protein
MIMKKPLLNDFERADFQQLAEAVLNYSVSVAQMARPMFNIVSRHEQEICL